MDKYFEYEIDLDLEIHNIRELLVEHRPFMAIGCAARLANQIEDEYILCFEEYDEFWDRILNDPEIGYKIRCFNRLYSLAMKRYGEQLDLEFTEKGYERDENGNFIF